MNKIKSVKRSQVYLKINRNQGNTTHTKEHPHNRDMDGGQRPDVQTSQGSECFASEETPTHTFEALWDKVSPNESWTHWGFCAAIWGHRAPSSASCLSSVGPQKCRGRQRENTHFRGKSSLELCSAKGGRPFQKALSDFPFLPDEDSDDQRSELFFFF